MIDQRTALWAALLLRVTLGSLFIAHLYWKFAILPGGLNTWWSNFATNKYPPITPWYCISAEVLGAVLLIPGIWTRWVALYAVPLIAGAAHYWTIRKVSSLLAQAPNCLSSGRSCLWSKHCWVTGHMP